MKNRITLDRSSFERLFLFRGIDPIVLNPVSVRRLQESAYPATTAQAIEELQCRGLRTDAVRLLYLAKAGHIPQPERAGGELRWGPADIDAAAAYLDEQQSYTASAWMRVMLGIDCRQECTALLQAQAAAGGEVHPAEFVRIVIPCDVESGTPALVHFRPMTDVERADRDARIARCREQSPALEQECRTAS